MGLVLCASVESLNPVERPHGVVMLQVAGNPRPPGCRFGHSVLVGGDFQVVEDICHVVVVLNILAKKIGKRAYDL